MAKCAVRAKFKLTQLRGITVISQWIFILSAHGHSCNQQKQRRVREQCSGSTWTAQMTSSHKTLPAERTEIFQHYIIAGQHATAVLIRKSAVAARIVPRNIFGQFRVKHSRASNAGKSAVKNFS
jgi:hypothetical protein